MIKKAIIFMGLAPIMVFHSVLSQDAGDLQPLLTVKEIMNGIVTPNTTTIWGAYQLKSEAEWLDLQNAALAVIGAGNLLALGGVNEGEQDFAQEGNWIAFNNEMIAAAREVISAVEDRNEEALSEAGNNSLYPPCESCHQEYQNP